MKVRSSLIVAVTLLGACHHGGGSPRSTAPVAAPPAAAPMAPGAVAPRSPADPVPGMSPASAPAAAGGFSLYTRLGGLDAIRAVVHDFVSRVGADTRINGFFRGVDLANLERLLSEQICQATGGPCTYTGRSMVVTHTGLNIHDDDFNALVEDLGAALDHFNVPAHEKSELLGALASMKGDIVGH